MPVQVHALPEEFNRHPLQAEDVRRAWGECRAVGGVSLQLREGEIYGLVGPDGGASVEAEDRAEQQSLTAA